MTETIKELRRKLRQEEGNLNRQRGVKHLWGSLERWQTAENRICTRIAGLAAQIENEIRKQGES